MNKVFSKYTKITASNGRPIHFFAQSEVSDENLARAREILRMYITPVANSRFGNSKYFIGNSLADSDAALYFFNTQQEYETHSSSLNTTPFNWQDLYADESFVEGSVEYLSNNRDASYEEILHLTHDYGITPHCPYIKRKYTKPKTMQFLITITAHLANCPNSITIKNI